MCTVAGRSRVADIGFNGEWVECHQHVLRLHEWPFSPYVLGARYVEYTLLSTLLRCARAGGLERWSSRLATVVSDGGGAGVFGRHTDHRGRHTVEDTLWKTRCGRRAVEDALW